MHSVSTMDVPAGDIVVGLISTGAMSTGQGTLFAQNGIAIFIGSRDEGSLERIIV